MFQRNPATFVCRHMINLVARPGHCTARRWPELFIRDAVSDTCDDTSFIIHRILDTYHNSAAMATNCRQLAEDIYHTLALYSHSAVIPTTTI